LDALRGLASVCLLREDYVGVKEYCRQVSIYNHRGNQQPSYLYVDIIRG
jgi:hypothetical protein